MATVRDYASLVKLSHSVFALPFALIALLVATGGWPKPRTLALVVVAMVCARTAAMAYNRFADRDVDARNPRTAGRELPRGVIRPGQALALTVVAGLAFVAAAAALGPVCGLLSLPVLAVLLGYSHAKRFTAWSHVWLGVALGLAPPAAWVAVTGAVDAGIVPALVLGLGVTLWVAGFDVLYACQDEAFDRAVGLHSIPARFGVARAMVLSRVAHAGAVVLFAAFGISVGLGLAYHAGVAAAAVFLALQHRVLRDADLRRLDGGFFTLNGVVGIALLSATLLDLYTL